MQRVLVIEDDPAMSQYIGEVLTNADFEVSSAFNGVTGLEAIRSSPSQVVVLDIFMPEKDGLEVLLEARRFCPELPVLVISGKQHLFSDSSMSLARQLGANDVLGKPFTPQELLDRITRLAGHRSIPPPAKQSAFTKVRERVRQLKRQLRKNSGTAAD